VLKKKKSNFRAFKIQKTHFDVQKKVSPTGSSIKKTSRLYGGVKGFVTTA
jgi:hypothetical protein